MNFKKLLANLVFYGFPLLVFGLVYWLMRPVVIALALAVLSMIIATIIGAIMSWAYDNKK